MPATAHSNPSPPLWRNVNFILMWTSTAASGFGDRMILFSAFALMGGLVAGTDASTAINAESNFYFFLPYVLFSAGAGWLADRLPRKWIMLACDEGRGLVLLACVLLVWSATGQAAIPEGHRWKVVLALLAVGTLAATFNASRNAIIPQLVPLRQLAGANAIILSLSVIAAMIGMVIGSRIIHGDAASSVRLGLGLAAGFYLVSGWFFAFLKPRDERRVLPPLPSEGEGRGEGSSSSTDIEENRRGETKRALTPGPSPSEGRGEQEGSAPRGRRSLWQAVRYATGHRRILELLAINVAIYTVATPLYAGAIGLAKTRLGMEVNDAFIFSGLMGAALGGGMLAGAGVVAALGMRREMPLVTALAIALSGVALAALVASPWGWLTLACGFLVGLFGNIVILCTLTLLQSLSPNYIRGRIMGLTSMANTIFAVVCYFAIWRLPESDRTIVWVLLALSPVLLVGGLLMAVWVLRSGPHENKQANTIHRLVRLFMLVYHRGSWRGRHHIPCDGPVILAPNHTAGLDPFIIQAALRRRVRWLMLESYHFKIAAPLWNAIEPIFLDDAKREGKRTSETGKIRQVVRILEEERDVVAIFPEGGLQREDRTLQPLQPGVVMIAKRSGAPIIPTWISGTPRRKSIAWQFLQPSHTRVTFGEPFFVGEMGANEALAELRRRMEALAGYDEHYQEELMS